MAPADKEAAGIISFDVISVTEKFAQENPDQLRTFLEVTHESNATFAAGGSNIEAIAKDAGLSVEATKAQMADFIFPTAEQQLNEYFNEGGMAAVAIGVVGGAFATAEHPALADYGVAIDTSFLK